MQEQEDVHTRHRASAETISVVIAHRHEVVALGLAALLENAGDITVPATTTDADALLDEASLASPDVVLLDIHLPPEGGFPVIRKLVHAVPDARVALLAPRDAAPAAATAVSAGARAVIAKSCSSAELLSALRAVAAGEVVLTSCFADSLVAGETAVLSAADILLLERFVSGGGQSEMARELLMSESTLKRKFSDVQRKLGARNRIDAVARAARMGLL